MPGDDLQKWLTSDADFYELLGLTIETFSESELRRAYRKTALKYHPDKVGKDFDPAKYEQFQAANEILGDPELKLKYDNHRAAKLQRQRANELFEGRRRQMKEDLEARERGGVAAAGFKRSREDDKEAEVQAELKRLAEEGRKRRAERAGMMAENLKAGAKSAPASAPPSPTRQTAPDPEKQAREDAEEEAIKRLEQKIKEAEEAKAKRKAEKKARKSGVFVPAESPSTGDSGAGRPDRQPVFATPTKRPDILKGLKADEKSSAPPKFSFSPSTPKTPGAKNFAETMARLKAAEKQRLEDEIRQQEAQTQ
nr:putative Pre-mRNA-splicing factor cwc23 [Xylogone sp. PMI_703]